MECTWDFSLLDCSDQLPPELLHIIQTGSNEEYLEAFTRASLDPRYTDLIFAHCHRIYAHVCSSLHQYGSIAAVIATFGRIIPFAPYLAPCALRVLADGGNEAQTLGKDEDILLYMLGLFRLLRADCRSFKRYVGLPQLEAHLHSPSRPVVYIAIRLLQLCLDGADHWFEDMLKRYLGEDSPNSDIPGLWDDKVIDYRFLTLWEDERYEKVLRLMSTTKTIYELRTSPRRIVPETCFHRNTTLIGDVLIPRSSTEPTHSRQSCTLVTVSTVSRNLRKFGAALTTSQSLLLAGLAGSGKTLLTRHIAQKLGKLDKMVTLHLNEQSDAKLLIGLYTTGSMPGTFVWKPGVLTTAVQEGRWVLIEDLDRAPNEIIGMLLPLIEKRELVIPNRKQTVHAADGFRIIATVRSSINHSGEETKPLSHMLGVRYWEHVLIDLPPTSEQQEIAGQMFPSLGALLPQFVAVFERLRIARRQAVLTDQSKTGVIRAVSPRDLFKWCRRVTSLLQQRSSFTSTDVDDIFLEAADCFVGALPDGPAKLDMSAIIAQELHIDPQRCNWLLEEREVRFEVDKARISVGRYSLPRGLQHTTAIQNTKRSFSINPYTSRILEQVAAATFNREPVLLVGETGVGKTTAVQHLAKALGKKLEPFNLSQQSEASDMLGGFKPVTARSLVVPMKDEFDELFRASFSMGKNQQFLELLGKQMANSNWRAVCKLWQQALKMVDQRHGSSPPRDSAAPSKKRKIESIKSMDFVRWDHFAAKVTDLRQRLSSGNDNFAFSFVEGNIVRAVRNGDWVLLDEINLATSDTLESIIDLLDPAHPSLLLTEAGNIERIEAHPDFRVFAAMNPATDVGKKDLPPGVRSRFTELYVESPDKDLRSLQSIVRSHLFTDVAADPAVALDVSNLYQQILGLAVQNKLVDGAGQKPHFSLRTLTRTLSYARYIAPQCNLRRALYEGFQMSFMTFLDTESARLIQPLLEQHLFREQVNIPAKLQKSLRMPADGHQYVQGYPGSKHWVRQGVGQSQEQKHYILTPFIRNNLENLVRAASTRQFPVLIQGPTSSGKTSMIEYLAKQTGHTFVRINNHEHTDLQEYLGSYVSGIDGRLVFQQGILVQALRKGHWIVLDELNLAPSDVLEALNRLLDENRELFIPETQEIVRPHEDFMLFATQNPAGLYGGRKTLSRAFRNRFLELHFDDIPVDELQEILHRRTQLPESRCKRIVTVYKELSILRQENRLFEHKSFATLRDLFRWAMRPNDTIQLLAENGFMLLAERVRKPEEREALKTIIEKVLSANGPRVAIDEDALYAVTRPEIVAYTSSQHSYDVVWTAAMRRLYTLVSRAIANNEPVLLVGETGCGKTTVCQMLADVLKIRLHTLNAHQNTETGDLIGSQRPVRNRPTVEAELRRLLSMSPLLQDHDVVDSQPIETLLQAYDEAVISLIEDERQQYCAGEPHVVIQAARTRLNALFEWVDGSLVDAMKGGAFFLLDEISLADDSVLERINSVLEPQRSILLAEKGSLDSFVSAAPGFQFFATMNPGGDYGKRELSPALRNRFTEIWVPSLSNVDDITQIVSEKLMTVAKGFAGAIVAFAQWFRDRYNTTASSSVSIRDMLAWVQFVNVHASMEVIAAVVHGAAMVYVDTLGANPAGLMTLTGRHLAEERKMCLEKLGQLVAADACAIYAEPIQFVRDNQAIRIGSFSIATKKGCTGLLPDFTFDASTTRRNAMRVVRALQIPKPVMLEGSPGVGKTALVTAIATAAGVPLLRVNLSEQTDLMDLFGSDAPVDGAAAGTFIWRDAPFLRAMQQGEWVLLDEMNLASQSVLEGLNACLDHRGEVFIPELGQSFSKHPDFRLFAAQNPHHQGGGRKGLPASLVNRFTVVYADAFTQDDLLLIGQRSFPSVDRGELEQVIRFVDRLESETTRKRSLGTIGGPWEFNLRDIFRMLTLMTSKHGLLGAGNVRDFSDLLFAQRFRAAADRSYFSELFDSVFQDAPQRSDLFCSISPLTLQLGLALLPRHSIEANAANALAASVRAVQNARILESVMLCIQQRWPVILTGPSGAGKTSLVEGLAATVGASTVTISLNADTDATDLIGGYEQTDHLREGLQASDKLHLYLSRLAKLGLSSRTESQAERLDLIHSAATATLAGASTLNRLARALKDVTTPSIDGLLASLGKSFVNSDKAQFEWSDGLLIDALIEGKWLILDNANLCAASVLDRLNSLLEPNGSLIINEHTEADGTPRVVHPHCDFRIFLLVDPRFGELSRPMRNRAVELFLFPARTQDLPMDLLQPESAMSRLQSVSHVTVGTGDRVPVAQLALIASDHLGLRDQPLLARFVEQIKTGLYDGMAHSLQAINIDVSMGRNDHLASFYKTAVGHAQAPADFACVQVSLTASL